MLLEGPAAFRPTATGFENSVWSSAVGREVYAKGAETGELMTKPEQIIVIVWAMMSHKSRSTISGWKLRYPVKWDPVKLTQRLWQYWDFWFVLLMQCCCEIHNTVDWGGMSHARWDTVPAAPSVRTSTLTLPLSIARPRHLIWKACLSLYVCRDFSSSN